MNLTMGLVVRRGLSQQAVLVVDLEAIANGCHREGDVGGQVLAAGLIDEVRMDVVPVVFGSGKRYFGSVHAQQLLEDPDVVIQATGCFTCAIGCAVDRSERAREEVHYGR